LQDRLARRALAATGLANQAEGLAALHFKREPIDSPDIGDLALKDNSRGDRKVDLQVFDLQQGFARDASRLARP
jgi:hypothetical protein